MADSTLPTKPGSNSLDAMFARGETIATGSASLERAMLGTNTAPLIATDKNGLVPAIKGQVLAATFHQFKRGDRAYDTEKDLRVTILKPGVAFSPKGVPYHKVVHRQTGESYIQRGTKLTHRIPR